MNIFIYYINIISYISILKWYWDKNNNLNIFIPVSEKFKKVYNKNKLYESYGIN